MTPENEELLKSCIQAARRSEEGQLAMVELLLNHAFKQEQSDHDTIQKLVKVLENLEDRIRRIERIILKAY